MKPYLYFDGLLRLTQEIQGTEVIHIGIRPYGFHAGNVMAFIVYPYLLCKYLEKLGKKARFKFIVSINDWEQDILDGPNHRKYPFNIFPKNTSIYFLRDERGCHKSIVDHWQPIIERNLIVLKDKYPDISFQFVRNSELINFSFCRELLQKTIKNPHEQFKILKANSDNETLKSPIQYAGVICPKCHRAYGKTTVVDNEIISWVCDECSCTTQDNIKNFQYWWYHKPMLLARMGIFKIDITLSGGDHFSEGDFNIRKAFIKKYAPTIKEPRMLFTPTVVTLEGERMSKGRNNTEFAKILKLINVVDGFKGKEIMLTEDLIEKNVNEKDYSYIL